MIQIKLTNEESNTIHVDDVDVSKGVYNKWDTDKIAYVSQDRDGKFEHIFAYYGASSLSRFPTLKDLMSISTGNFFTLDGRRIVTEKELTVEDLTNDMHIGFVNTDNEKGYIAHLGRGVYIALYNSGDACCNDAATGRQWQSIYKCLEELPLKEVWKFPVRDELYTWLGKPCK